jgi:hypothetical protein
MAGASFGIRSDAPVRIGGASAGASFGIGQPTVGSTGLTAAQIAAKNANQALSDQLTRQKQEELNQAERDRMAMSAARLALDQSYGLAADANNPREITGTQMTISNAGSYGGSSSSRSYGSSSGSGSGGGAMDTSAIEALIAKYAPSPAPVAPPPPPPQVAAPVAPTRAANTAKAFANAKNISGRQGQAAIRALHDTMTRRGMSDSGFEAEGEANILGDVANFNSDAAFRSDLADDDRTWEAAQMGFQGALSQRNSDMGYLQSGYQGGIAQRGQDLDRQALILNLLGRRY